MNTYYYSIMSLVNQEMIAGAATALNEGEERIHSTSSSIVAGLLGLMLKRGNTFQVNNILEEAGTRNILLEFRNLWADRPTHEQLKIGNELLQELLGDQAARFTDPIAETNEVSNVIANKLCAMIAPLFCGYLGNKLVKENKTVPMILNEISRERDDFQEIIPADLIDSFGLSSVLNSPIRKRKKSNTYTLVIWVVLIALFLFFLLLGLKYYRYLGNETFSELTYPDTVGWNPVSQEKSLSTRKSALVMTLPDSSTVQVDENGWEEKSSLFS